MAGILESYLQGRVMRQQEQRQQRQSAMEEYLRGNSSGIMSGDPAALSGLAEFDPMMAIQLQGQKKNQQRADVAASRADTVFRQGQEDRERAAAAERIKSGVSRALSLPDTPEGRAEFDRMISADPALQKMAAGYSDPFDAREAMARQVLGLVKQLEGMEPARPLSPAGKLKADHDAGLITDQQFAVESSGSGMRVESDGQGGFILEQGKGVTGGRAPSERQSTLHLFGGLMNETMPEINALEADPNFNPTSARSQAAGAGVAGNVVTSTEAQRYESLKRQWAEGVLRIQTGAAATQPEIERVMQTYFPVFGDSEQTVRQKQIQRDIFARSLTEASNGNVQAPGGADQRPGLGPEVSFQMTPEQQRVFEKYSQQ